MAEEVTCPRFGAILYGAHCIGCDCGLADPPSVRFDSPPCREHATPAGRVSGFDTSSGPDKTATYRVSGYGFEWTMEELERASPAFTRAAEEHVRREAKRRQREVEEQLLREFKREQVRQAYARTRSAGSAGRSYVVEIITDPADPRGRDARPVSGRA